jgi:hypothetical protein
VPIRSEGEDFMKRTGLLHVNGLLIGYVADAKLGFVTDLWSPGAGALPDRLNPNLGYGSIADYAPLAARDGK